MNYLGEYTPGKTVRCRFNTHKADGTPITLAGTPAISVYKGSTTESTAGVTLTVDYDARTGLHDVAVDTSADGTFYAAGNDFDLILTAGTVDAISVVGSKVGMFSLNNRAFLRPTTADRTLDVSAGGEAGLDWANVGTPGSTVALSGTTVGVVTANSDKTGYSLTSGERSTLATVILSDVTDTLGLDIVSILAGTNALTSRLTAGRATNLDFLTATPPTSAAVADAVWDEVLSDHLTSGTTGGALNAAGAAGDPWSTAIPGAYGAGTAGHRLGNVPDVAPGAAGALLVAGANATATGIVLDLAQTLNAARPLDSIADTSLTLNDAMHSAIAGATGKELVSGTTYIIKTPSTGTVLRTFALDSATAPTSRT